MDILVGYTGFVGGNLVKQHKFDKVYNSQNIKDAYETKPDLLVYAGVTAAMYIANQEPEKDFGIIENAINNIKKIKPKKLVLISTVAVYDNLIEVDEEWEIDPSKLSAYGKNRLFLEKWIQENIKDHLIIRLPAIYGDGLKKNFIYDYIHLIPNMLKDDIYEKLIIKNPRLSDFYVKLENNFYKCKELEQNEKIYLKNYFKNCGFNALNFTDSRSIYQFYSLSHLWEHIIIALKNGISLLNITVEPISISELYYELTGSNFNNKLTNNIPYKYNLKTKYDLFLGGENGYIYSKNIVLQEIKEYIEQQNKEGLK